MKTVVETPEQVEDPHLQITLEDARKVDPNLEVGGELQIPKVTEGILGRIAAQLAKQVIFQKVREAERDTVYNEYIGRVNEIVNATVKRVEGPDVIFDIGKAEARMPRKEQSRLESFAIGERVRVVIARVERASKGPGVVVSRAAPDLVQHLFQTEVPEIYDGTVVIRAIAREAGERTKIAVMSKDKDVDAVGACVGMKGMRVQSIIRELRGEKIDIIEYHEDAVTFAEKALQPAKVSRVTVVDSGRKASRSCGRRQPALACHRQEGAERPPGREAAGLEDRHQERGREASGSRAADVGDGPQTTTPLESVPGLGEGLVEKLSAAGVTTVEALADMTPEQLEAIEGIGPKTVEKISLAVNNYFASLEPGAAVEGAAEGELDGGSLLADEEVPAEAAASEEWPPGSCSADEAHGEADTLPQAREVQAQVPGAACTGSGIRFRNKRIIMTRWHKFEGVGPKKLTP